MIFLVITLFFPYSPFPSSPSFLILYSFPPFPSLFSIPFLPFLILYSFPPFPSLFSIPFLPFLPYSLFPSSSIVLYSLPSNLLLSLLIFFPNPPFLLSSLLSSHMYLNICFMNKQKLSDVFHCTCYQRCRSLVAQSSHERAGGTRLDHKEWPSQHSSLAAKHKCAVDLHRGTIIAAYVEVEGEIEKVWERERRSGRGVCEKWKGR